MATSFKKYDKATVYINGNLLSDEASVSIKFTSGLQKVYTVQRGFAGVSKGAEECSVSIQSAIAVDGMEWLPADIPAGEIINVAVFVGSKTFTSNAIVMDFSVSHSVNDHAKVSYDLAAQYSDFV